MSPTHERTALKEWAVLCAAMAEGRIIAMVRKLQPRFRDALAAAHAAQPRAGEVHLALVASVAAVWTASDLAPLQDIEQEHGLAWSAVESRFHYKDRPGVQVVAVRVARLAEPARVPEEHRYQGCVSWVTLDAALPVAAAVPVVHDDDLARRIAALCAALGPPDDGRTPL